MSIRNIYEVFGDVERAGSRAERVTILRNNRSWALEQVLRGTYDPRVEFDIIRVPLYRPSDSPPGLSYSSMTQELNRVYLFEKGNPRKPSGLTAERQEQILIQILEMLESKEAEIYMNMLLKKQKVKGLTPSIVKEAFPDWLP